MLDNSYDYIYKAVIQFYLYYYEVYMFICCGNSNILIQAQFNSI